MGPSNVSEIGLTSLTYISRSTLAIDGDAPEVDRIVEVAVARNRPLRVTGALLYTQLHFAQVLEGPTKAIEELMTSIRRDKRHRDVTVVAQHRTTARKFADWAMAYAGPIPYLDRQLKPLLSPMTGEDERLSRVESLVGQLRRLQADRQHV